MPTLTNTSAHRSLAEIAAEIKLRWVRKDGSSAVWYGAKPYLNAMLTMDRITDKYGADDGRSIVAYFIGNATTWKGEDAKRIKKELRDMLKDAGR